MLTPTEARLAAELAKRFGELVPDGDLAKIVRVGEPPVRIHMTRLRAQLRAMGLHVSRVRGQGYLMKSR
jgi:DNA-binding response OmpR family regulator